MKELAALLITASIPFALFGIFKKHKRVTLFTIGGIVFMAGWAVIEFGF